MRTRSLAFVVLALLLALAAFVASGCSLLGKGMEVADAYNATQNAKSGAYSGSYSSTRFTKEGKAVASATGTFEGAWDELNPKKPKFRLKTFGADDDAIYIAPGNGKLYVSDGRWLDSITLGKNKKFTDQKSTDKVNNAFASSLVNFRDGEPNGQTRTIVADISRVQLCGPSLRQFVRVINNDSRMRRERIHISKKITRLLSQGCVHTLATPPMLSFGITGGLLTDFSLDFSVRESRTSKERVAVHFELHMTGIGQPQGGFRFENGENRPIWAPQARRMRAAAERAVGAPLR